MNCHCAKTGPLWVCLPYIFCATPPIVCKKVCTVQIELKSVPSFTYQTHIILTHCIIVRLSRNSYIWYSVFIKYSQNYKFSVFYFVSREVGTEIFCVMIPSLTLPWMSAYLVWWNYVYKNLTTPRLCRKLYKFTI